MVTGSDHARRLRLETGAILLLMTLACGGSTPGAPQTPSPVVTVTSVTVTTASTGTQFQCTAIATFSDGSTQTVTLQATWTSSDPSVATVTSTGLVTPISNGSTSIAATYSGVTGTLLFTVAVSRPVPTPTYTLSGTVRDSSTGAALAGAQAEVIDGADAGKKATADGAGRYTLSGLSAGQFRVYFRNNGYDTFPATVTLSGDQTLDVALTRTATPAPSPPPSPTPPAPTTYTLTGVIRATPLNEVLVDARIEALQGATVQASTTTDGTGSYRLAGLAAQQYVLRMTKTGYNASNRDVTVSADALLDIVMDRNRVTIQGFVDEAQPCTGTIQGTRVEVVDGPDAGKFGLNDRTGFRYQIAGVAWGAFRLRASKPTYTSVEVTLTVPAPLATESTVTQHFRLPNPTGRFVLSGEVSNTMIETAGQINGALVEIVDGPNAGKTATSGSAGLGNGVYRFADLLASGVLGFRVSKTDFVSETFANGVLCGDAQRNVKLTPTNATLTGVVRDEASAALAGANVEIISGTPAGKSALTDASGQYSIVGIYGEFAVRVSKTGYVTEQRTITTGPSMSPNFVLKKSP